MRALTAIVALAVCSPSPALAHDILATLGVSPRSPVHNLITCTTSLGPTKCISALSTWRAERALQHLDNDEQPTINMTADVKQFPWKRYSNTSDEQMYSQLCDRAERLLRYRSMTFTMIPGYSFQLESKANGKLSVDVLKNDVAEGRGMLKKLQKQFYELVPIMIIPGLMMSAVLPFILPTLKLMTVAVGMLNNMALSGAVFTLLRNNAFNDYYEKKIIYVNEGYKNEHHPPLYYKGMDEPIEILDFHRFSPSNIHETVVKPDGTPDNVGNGNTHFVGNTQFVEGSQFPGNSQLAGNPQFGDISSLQNMANLAQFDDVELSNAQWIDEYYGNEGATNSASNNNNNNVNTAAKVRRSSQRKTSVKQKLQ